MAEVSSERQGTGRHGTCLRGHAVGHTVTPLDDDGFHIKFTHVELGTAPAREYRDSVPVPDLSIVAASQSHGVGKLYTCGQVLNQS